MGSGVAMRQNASSDRVSTVISAVVSSGGVGSDLSEGSESIEFQLIQSHCRCCLRLGAFKQSPIESDPIDPMVHR